MTSSFALAVSIQFTVRRALTRGLWRVLCAASVKLAGIPVPFENTRSSGWVIARFYDSGSIPLFLQAFFGIQSSTLGRQRNCTPAMRSFRRKAGRATRIGTVDLIFLTTTTY